MYFYLRRYRLLVISSGLLSGLSSIFDGIGAAMIVPILQSIEGSSAPNVFTGYAKALFEWFGLEFGFLNLALIFTMLMLFKYGTSALQTYTTRAMSSGITSAMRERAFEGMMSVSLKFYYKHKVGDIISTIYTSTQNAGAVIEHAVMLMVDILFCLAYIAISLLISVKLTIAAYLLVAVSFCLVIPRFKDGYIQGKDEKRMTDSMSSFLLDKLSGIKIIKICQNEAANLDAFGKIAQGYRRLSIRIQQNRIMANLLIEPFITITAVIIMCYAILALRMPAAMLITFFYIISRVIPRVKLINTNWLAIMNYLPHISTVGHLIDAGREYHMPDGRSDISGLTSSIRFENVYYRYNDESSIVLDNVNIAFEKNKTTALIGGSGGGKTTLIDLIARHHDPIGGRISVDGIDLKELKIDSWRKLLGVVEQEPYIFYDTVRNNILCSKPDATLDEVVNAARCANAHEFIEKLPKKYETIIGERGQLLSGGQRQRISLARALLKEPRVLILDEATSALDSESEKLIRDSIAQFAHGMTIIIIAHRLSAVAVADKLIVIERGEVVEEGNPKELLERDGFYAKYHKLQFGNNG